MQRLVILRRKGFAVCRSKPTKLCLLFVANTYLLLGVLQKNSVAETFQEQAEMPYCTPLADPEPKVDVEQLLPTIKNEAPWMKEIVAGGSYFSADCAPREKVAIVIPYRNRSEHLEIFTKYMHPFLMKQKRFYTIYVISQIDEFAFNRGSLFNVGVREILKLDNSIGCFILHDVDTLPIDRRLIYECSSNKTAVRIIANYQSKWNYKFQSHEYVGGVMAIHRDQFMRTNGFSNCYWTWGGEDNDFGFRIKHYNLAMDHEVSEISRYYNLHHIPEETVFNNNRMELIHYAKRLSTDGLNSLDYKNEGVFLEPLYTRIDIAFNFEEMRKICTTMKLASLFGQPKTE